MLAPASKATPWRAGRHRAATTTKATTATITATFPAITGAGFAKALPAVRDCVAAADVRRVKLSHDGANATAAPIAASAASINVGMASLSWPCGLTSEPAGEPEHEAGAHEVRTSGDHRAGIRKEEAERDDTGPYPEERPDPQAGTTEQDEQCARAPYGQVNRMRNELGRLLG